MSRVEFSSSRLDAGSSARMIFGLLARANIVGHENEEHAGKKCVQKITFLLFLIHCLIHGKLHHVS